MQLINNDKKKKYIINIFNHTDNILPILQEKIMVTDISIQNLNLLKYNSQFINYFIYFIFLPKIYLSYQHSNSSFLYIINCLFFISRTGFSGTTNVLFPKFINLNFCYHKI